MSQLRRPIASVAVIGAGTMGSGIAQVVAAAGLPVLLIDRGQAEIDRGLATIQKNLGRLVEKGRLTAEDAATIAGRVRTDAVTLSAVQADLVIEAVYENLDLKRSLCRDITAAQPTTALYATNTSSISVTALASAAADPTRVVGMHFFNPVPFMKLVEIVRAEQTDAATVAAVIALASTVGKTPVEVADAPGFVANRILIPMINEAIFTLGEGVATAEAIDQVMTLGAAHPMGPLALADLIGLDVCLAIMEVLHRDFGDSKYRPAPLLRRMVAAGKLGRKSGEGFFTYER